MLKNYGPTDSCEQTYSEMTQLYSAVAWLFFGDTSAGELKTRRTTISWLVVSNIFYFHPYLGKIPILTNIFQMGWNHQLDLHWLGKPTPDSLYSRQNWWFSRFSESSYSWFTTWNIQVQFPNETPVTFTTTWKPPQKLDPKAPKTLDDSKNLPTYPRPRTKGLWWIPFIWKFGEAWGMRNRGMLGFS